MRPFLILTILLLTWDIRAQKGREHFVYLHQVVSDVLISPRYYSKDNFVGAQVDGYKKPTLLISKAAGQALGKVQEKLRREGLGLKIFDAYRPQKAVDHFVRWAKDPADTLTKAKYYPETKKSEVFRLGYVASKSGHTRGSTIDLTIIDLETKEEIDMGSGWDFFGEISWHSSDLVDPKQKANRRKLKAIMEKYGFKAYSKEWWHYTLRDEPFPTTYFDFDVE